MSSMWKLSALLMHKSSSYCPLCPRSIHILGNPKCGGMWDSWTLTSVTFVQFGCLHPSRLLAFRTSGVSVALCSQSTSWGSLPDPTSCSVGPCKWGVTAACWLDWALFLSAFAITVLQCWPPCQYSPWWENHLCRLGESWSRLLLLP